MGKIFGDSMWGKLQANPTTRAYLQDPAFVQKLKLLQTNPQLLGSFSQDPKLSTAIGVILGIDLGGAGGGAGPFGGGAGGAGGAPGSQAADDDGEDVDMSGGKDKATGKEEEIHIPSKKERENGATPTSTFTTPSAEPKSAAADSSAAKSTPAASAAAGGAKDQKDVKSSGPALNKEAEEEKKKGNDLYNQKKFEDAIKHYQKASEIDPKNATYILNTTAALLESKKIDETIALCQKGIEVATENMAGFEVVSKFWLRIANAQMAAKKYTEAITAFNKSLVEHGSDKARAGLKKAQQLQKEAEANAYLDKGKSLEAKERGNKLFKSVPLQHCICLLYRTNLLL